MIFALDFMYHFTCGESNLTKIVRFSVIFCLRLSKTFFPFSRLITIQVTKDTKIFAQDEISFKKASPVKAENFLTTLFFPKHVAKKCLQTKGSI